MTGTKISPAPFSQYGVALHDFEFERLGEQEPQWRSRPEVLRGIGP